MRQVQQKDAAQNRRPTQGQKKCTSQPCEDLTTGREKVQVYNRPEGKHCKGIAEFQKQESRPRRNTEAGKTLYQNLNEVN